MRSAGHRRATAVAALLLACAPGEPDRPTTLTVAVDSATALEVVDWGGRGPPVLFLAGLGHTAHVFDDLAPALTDAYRVLGLTRRGFGASSVADSGYDLASLAEDIRVVLDSLGIARVVLVGHSLGGDEMTVFARAHPARTAALVYLDAAYQRATTRDSLAAYVAPASEHLPARAADSASVEAYRAYYRRVNGVTMPRSEIAAMFRWTPDGRFDGSPTPGWVYDRIVADLGDQDYAGLDVPALAVYGVEYPVTELFLDYDRRDAATQDSMRAYLAASQRIAALSRDAFREQMRRSRVVPIRGAGHSLYITHAGETLAAVRAFLHEVL